MVLFYSNNFNEDTVSFSEMESRHMISSLRKREGDIIHFVDGIGNIYKATLILVGKKQVVAQVDQSSLQPRKRKYKSHIAIAPTKNMDRIEWFVEKSIEIGIDEISFIKTAHSERKVIKMERIHKIVQSASKQSLNAYFPIVNELKTFKEFLQTHRHPNSYIAVVGNQYSHIAESPLSQGDVTCLIGPEGGFREDEINMAIDHHYKGVSLGNRRLRTETAGIVATTLLHERIKV